MWQWAMRPLTTIDRSPSESRKSCSESSCSANGRLDLRAALADVEDGHRLVDLHLAIQRRRDSDAFGVALVLVCHLLSGDYTRFMPTTSANCNFVDGEWVPSTSGSVFENRNPANTNDLIGVYQQSGPADVDRAIAAAANAYESWRLVPAPIRAEMLFKAAQIIAARKEEFARDMTREMGKVLNETRGDVQEAIDMTFYMAGEGRRMFGQTVPSELRNKFAMSVRQPLGVCSIITPWNFPMAIPSWKIVPALVCGNTVVFKPSSNTPLSAVNFVNVLIEAGIPKGVVNLVTGDADVGTAMTTDPRVSVVSFTGSTRVGRIVNEAAASTFKKVHLEMGGKNVVMIMEDADLELAVDGCLWGGFGTTGQRCTAASRVVVHEKVSGSSSTPSSAREDARRRRRTSIRRWTWARRTATRSSRP
jgi:aldehyde dehydrogenase (NAD+)